MIQLLRVLFKVRFNFQQAMVLVDLRVHRIDLSLTEGVVQCVVDCRWRDAYRTTRRDSPITLLDALPLFSSVKNMLSNCLE